MGAQMRLLRFNHIGQTDKTHGTVEGEARADGQIMQAKRITHELANPLGPADMPNWSSHLVGNVIFRGL